MRRIAEALGIIANIPEGSVRKGADRIRIKAQLITAADGSRSAIWAGRNFWRCISMS